MTERDLIAKTMWEAWSTNPKGWDGDLLPVERKSFLDVADKVSAALAKHREAKDAKG